MEYQKQQTQNHPDTVGAKNENQTNNSLEGWQKIHTELGNNHKRLLENHQKQICLFDSECRKL
jgi:hypothetical protein